MMEDGFKSMMSWQEKVDVQLGDIVVWLGNLEEEVKTLKNNNKGKEKVVETESEGRREDVDFGYENFGFGEGTSAGRHEDVVGEASASEPSHVDAASEPSHVAAASASEPSHVIAASEPSPVPVPVSVAAAASEPSHISAASASEPSHVAAASEPSLVPVPVSVACPPTVSKKRKTRSAVESLPSELPEKRKTRSSKYINTPFTEWKKKKGSKEGSKEGNKEGNKKGNKKGKKK